MKVNELMVSMKKALLLTVTAASLVSCGGGGGGGNGGGGSTYGAQNSSYISAQSFVNSLNDVDYTNGNELIKDTYETVRGGDDWFVVWDQEHAEYVAVSLQYIRTITYYDYYSNNFTLAEEYRDIQLDDEAYSGLIGDGYGDDYEIVDFAGYDSWGDELYRGFDSGFLYEDEEETFDVSLMAAEQEKKEFFKKASAVSFTYNVDISTSMALVTLGNKVEGMLNKNAGEVTDADQLALMGDLEKLTGASLDEINAAAQDVEKKEVLLDKIAKKIGTSTDNLENRLLPEVFGLDL